MTLTEKINKALDDNKTVQVSTALHITRVKAKNRKDWREAGFEFFKSDDGGSAYMITGQRNGKPKYDCIDYCSIKVF